MDSGNQDSFKTNIPPELVEEALKSVDNIKRSMAEPQEEKVEETEREFLEILEEAEGRGEGDRAEELEGEVASLRAEVESCKDQLLRKAADLENYKKRAIRERKEAANTSLERVVKELLPVVDNLERALSHGQTDQGTIVEGVTMIQKQFLDALAKFDVKPFDSLGQPFDPNLHEAVQSEVSDLPAGSVTRELQRGYLVKERLLRPAMVVVSRGPAEG